MSIIENCVENFNFERKRKTAFEMSFENYSSWTKRDRNGVR